MDEQTKALRAVIETARKWAGQNLQLDEGTKLYDLREAVEALDAHLTRAAAGFVVTRTWATTLAGMWVQAPNGVWYEVISNRDAGNGNHLVKMRIGGNLAEYPRKSDAKVKVRTRTALRVEDDAVQLLSAAFDATVIESPPWE